jgi:hypothetical protein
MGLGIKIPRNALAQGREAFAANPSHGESVSLEPGEYFGLIAKLKAVDTKKGPQLVADITVGENENSPEAKGGSVSLWFCFEPERIIYLFRFLKSLGYGDRLEDLDEDSLSEIAKEIPGKNLVVKFRATESEGGHINIRLKKVMDEMTPDEIGLEENATKPTKGKGKPTPGKKAPKEEEPEPEAEVGGLGHVRVVGAEVLEDDQRFVLALAGDGHAGLGGGFADEEIIVKVGLVCKTKIKGKLQEIKVLKLLPEEDKVIAQVLATEEQFKIKRENLE